LPFSGIDAFTGSNFCCFSGIKADAGSIFWRFLGIDGNAGSKILVNLFIISCLLIVGVIFKRF
jgi:hypothetical protein